MKFNIDRKALVKTLKHPLVACPIGLTLCFIGAYMTGGEEAVDELMEIFTLIMIFG